MIAPIAVALAVGLLGWAYKSLKPPPPRICGSPDGPPVTSTRVKLSDGRHLAYRESGVRKEEAKYKIIVVHGYDSSKDLGLPVPQVWTNSASLILADFFNLSKIVVEFPVSRTGWIEELALTSDFQEIWGNKKKIMLSKMVLLSFKILEWND